MKSTSNSPIARLAKGAIFTAVAAVLASSAAQANYLLLNSLSITAGGTLMMDEGTSLVPANVVTVSSNGLIVQAPDNAGHLTNIANIRGWLNSGYNGGLWDGTGIASLTAETDALSNGVLAVMFYDNAQLNYVNYAGATGLPAPFDQSIARVTYAGDFDSSGTVDASDYGLLDFYLGSSLIAQGDLNADALLDSGDYGLVDFVLGNQVYGSLGAVGSFSGGGGKSGGVVPEPGSAMLLLSGAVGLLGLRRRK